MQLRGTTRATVLLSAVLVSSVATAGELVVMPYRCSMAGGLPVLTPSDQQGYRIVGERQERRHTACSPVNPDVCRAWTVHRFDMDCAGTRVSWTSVVVGSPAARRAGAWLDAGRMHLPMPPFWTLPPDDPCVAALDGDGGWRGGRARRYCADRLAMMPAGIVEMPAGYAPTFGLDAVFVADRPVAGTEPEIEDRSASASPSPRWIATPQAPPLTPPPPAVRPESPTRKQATAPVTSTPPAGTVASAEPPPTVVASPTPEPKSSPPEQPPARSVVSASPPAATKPSTPEPAKAEPSKPAASIDAAKVAPPAANTVATPSPDAKPAGTAAPRPSTAPVVPTIINRTGAPPAPSPTASLPDAATVAAAPTPSKARAASEIRSADASAPTQSAVEPIASAAEPIRRPESDLWSRTYLVIGVGLAIVLSWLAFQMLGRRPKSIALPQPPRDFAAISLGSVPAAAKPAATGSVYSGPSHERVEPSFGPMTDVAMPKTTAEAIAVLGMGLAAESGRAAMRKVVDGLRQSWHPDLATDEADRQVRELKIKQINAAWDILSKPDRPTGSAPALAADERPATL